MSRFAVLLTAAFLVCGCSVQPTYIDPHAAPLLLRPGMTAQTTEPQRYVCTTRAALVCERVGRLAWAECECLP